MDLYSPHQDRCIQRALVLHFTNRTFFRNNLRHFTAQTSTRPVSAISSCLRGCLLVSRRCGPVPSGLLYHMVSGLQLFKRGGERYGRNHSHWAPLLRLLADVNGLGGEWFKRRFEAGEQLLLIVHVFRLHYDAVTTQQRAKRNHCPGATGEAF